MPIQANWVIGLDGHFSFLINALECIYCHMSHMHEISQFGEVNSSVLSQHISFLSSKGYYTEKVERKPQTCKAFQCMRLIADSSLKRAAYSNRNNGGGSGSSSGL